MLAALVAGLLAATAPCQAESATPASRPGVVVLVASPLRDRVATWPRRAGTHVQLGIGAHGPVRDARDGATDVNVACGVHKGMQPEADLSVARLLSGASEIELQAGTWLDWHLAAHDGRHEREWTRALRAAHENGARIVATGEAATWIARHTIVPRDVVQKPSQDPHDTTLDVPVEGLGLFDAALVGVLADGAPTPDRFVERTLAYGIRDMLLLDGDVALAWDASTRRATVHGPGTAAWIGLSDGKRSRGSVRGARAAILSDGDVFDTRRDALVDGQRVEPRALGSVLPFGPRTLRRTLAGEKADGSAAVASWIASAQAALDERSLRRPGGGWSGVLLDLEVQAP